MRILNIERQPLHRVRYTRARQGGGAETASLEILEATVDKLPEGIEGLLATSDLQGVVAQPELDGETCLLGEHLPDELWNLSGEGRFPNPASLGAVLAGDLYSAPAGNVRGATGDVQGVWRAFAEGFSWVAGVAGNHDLFGSEREQRRLTAQPNVHLLDGDAVLLGNTLIGGVGYIIGDPTKAGRRDQGAYMAALSRALERGTELLVLHNGPSGDRTQRGSAEIREVLLDAPPVLVICGHSHWDSPLHELENGSQILNVDGRVILLRK